MTDSIVITTTVQQILPSATLQQRAWITLQLAEGETNPVVIGVSEPSVTASTGMILRPGAIMTIENDTLSKPAAKAVYALTASGTANLRVNTGA